MPRVVFKKTLGNAPGGRSNDAIWRHTAISSRLKQNKKRGGIKCVRRREIDDGYTGNDQSKQWWKEPMRIKFDLDEFTLQDAQEFDDIYENREADAAVGREPNRLSFRIPSA